MIAGPVAFLPTGSANALFAPRVAAGRTARLVNVSEIAGPFGVSRTTVRDYLILLGQLVETFVVQELRRQASGWEYDVRFSHYRDKDKQQEVDIVLERGPSRVVGIEVKTSATQIVYR